MCNNGNCSCSTFSYTIIFVFIFAISIKAEICETESINVKLRVAISSGNVKKYMPYANLHLPSCAEFSSRSILKGNIPAKSIENSFRWINMYINLQQCCIAKQMYFTKMGKTDDWIVAFCENGCEQDNIKYLQYIDSRSLTVFVQKDNDLIYIKKDPQSIVNKNKYLNWNTIAPTNYLKVKIKYADTNEIFGAICVDTNYFYSNITNDFCPHFWCNKVCIVFNFPKIHVPKRSVFGYDAALSIGGIIDSSKTPYIIFNEQKKVNFNTEMLKIYPWIEDSLKVWKSKSSKF